eukprot:s3403_g8.t1
MSPASTPAAARADELAALAVVAAGFKWTLAVMTAQRRSEGSPLPVAWGGEEAGSDPSSKIVRVMILVVVSGWCRRTSSAVNFAPVGGTSFLRPPKTIWYARSNFSL